MLFSSSKILCFYRPLCPLGKCVQRGVEIRKEQKPCKKWEEVELQHFFEVWWHFAVNILRFPGRGPFPPPPSPGGPPVLFPCPSRSPCDCSTFMFLFLPVIAAVPGSPQSGMAGCDTDLALQFYISCLSVSVSWDTYHCKIPEWITLFACSTHEHTGGIFSLATMRSLCPSYSDCTNTLLHSF